MISVKNLSKIYKIGKGRKAKSVVALNNISIDFPDKGLVFLLGKSGSGKSTLLNSIGGLDTFDSGEIIIKGKSSKDFKQQDFDSYRNTFIGFIFQEYNILEEFSVGKNLSIALELQGKPVKKDIVNNLLEQVDLAGYYRRKPNQLSGGQKQRVAIARALIKDPEIIMADEPTGALDSTTGKQVFDTLKKLSETKLVIVVSHDREFAEIYGDRIIELKDGCIIRDDTKTEVEAVKTNSGVSFIDDKIVHIKKGQQLTNEDLTKIGMMLVKNTKEEDVFISFDSKTNQEVKKTAFITDEGNREVFIKTEAEHIERKEHNPNDFKMIKSKLKFKDAFKMGASSLKHKTIRLIFTILLSVVAFTMFGMVDTMASFSEAESVYQTVSQLDIKTLAVKKSGTNAYDALYSSYPLSEEDITKIKNQNKDYNFYKTTYVKSQYDLSGFQSKQNDQAYFDIHSISGIMPLNDDVKKDLNLELIYGKDPEADNEICISKHMYDSILATTTCSGFEELENKNFSIYIENSWNYFKIVGVVKDDTDMSRYSDLRNDNSSRMENQMRHQELEMMLYNGLTNMCYVSQSVFDAKYSVRDVGCDYYAEFHTYIPGQDFMGGGYSECYHNLNKQTSLNIAYIKPGCNVNSLTKKQAIVSLAVLTENLYISSDDVNTKINNGLKVGVSMGYPYDDSNKAFEFDIIGYTNETNSADIYLVESLYNEHFVGCDSLITRIKGNSTDKQLLKNIYYEGSLLTTITPATPAMASIGSFVDSATNIFLYIGLGLAFFAGLMLMNFISTSISYKKKEIGVLRAIGARSKDVFSIFFLESLVICLINFVLSVISCGVVCFFVSKSFVEGLGVSLYILNFGIRQVILMGGVSLIIAFISTFFPVFKFARKNPIDSINNR